MAHFLSLLLVQGQLIIPLASDPFGFGWDIFGTAGYRIDPTVVSTKVRVDSVGGGDSRRAHRVGLYRAYDSGQASAPATDWRCEGSTRCWR